MGKPERRLAAIMFTDVVGYAALVHDNEALAQDLLETHRRLIRPLIGEHRGREIKTIGDAFHVEFASALQAVRCAMQIQSVLHAHNLGVSPERRIWVRIGIHVGDVEEAEGDIYGDGVNIAARIESLAEPGGICVSGQARDQILDRLETELEDLGQHHLKNIARPIRLYRVVLPWGERTETGEGIEPDSESRKSIAVLPFANLSPEPENEYFSDGLTEELINALAHIPGLRVPARTSVFTFKGKDEQIVTIGKQLNVNTVLEGSVRKWGDRVRVTAQLVNVADGYHLWSENFDRQLGDIFAIQDEVATAVVEALKPHWMPGEHHPLIRQHTDNLEAYTLYLQGRAHFNRGTVESIREALSLYERALELEPEYALAYAGLADAYAYLAAHGELRREEGATQAKGYAQRALELDASLAEGYTARARIRSVLDRDLPEAERELQQAILIKPSSADAHALYASLLHKLGRHDEALAEVSVALQLDPLSASLRRTASLIYASLRRYDEMREQFEKQLELNPEAPAARHNLSIYRIAFKRDWEGAREVLEEGIRVAPDSGAMYINYALHLAARGDQEAATRLGRRALELNPREIWIQLGIVSILTAARRYDEAETQLGQALRIDPNEKWLHYHLGRLYLYRALHEEALEAFRRAAAMSANYIVVGVDWVRAMEGVTLAKMGHRSQAQSILADIKENLGAPDRSSMIALIHFALEEVDQGFEWLDRAFEEHDIWLGEIDVEPLLDDVRSDPRYRALLKKMKFPVQH